MQDLMDGVEAGEFQVWEGERSVIVTKLMQHPQMLEAYCFLAAGDLAEIASLYHVVLDWAISKGCRRASCLGRPGWAKTFLTRAEGWTAPYTVFQKELP
jgi:hypothetical protein